MLSARKNHKTNFHGILCPVDFSNKNSYFSQNFCCCLLLVVVFAGSLPSHKGNMPSIMMDCLFLLIGEKFKFFNPRYHARIEKFAVLRNDAAESRPNWPKVAAQRTPLKRRAELQTCCASRKSAVLLLVWPLLFFLPFLPFLFSHIPHSSQKGVRHHFLPPFVKLSMCRTFTWTPKLMGSQVSWARKLLRCL